MAVYKQILLTGGSGMLGQKIASEPLFANMLLTPSHTQLDICRYDSIIDYFTKYNIDAVIHTAALARMIKCDENAALAIDTNIIGTANLVKACLANATKNIRFIHISTDGVYESTVGKYSEDSPVKPYNIYGYTKLAAENAVLVLANKVIIRTRFFNPQNIIFDTAPDDLFTSKVEVDYLVKAIYHLLYSDFQGIVNVGDVRMSEYERNKKYKADIKPCKRTDIIKDAKVALAADASMDTSSWSNFLQTNNIIING
ncbi:MAG: sugar nucleotide-binding protein [Cytophagales bacterium]|nr:sugar nucleotide-binding protein [Cytophagales bacterium]